MEKEVDSQFVPGKHVDGAAFTLFQMVVVQSSSSPNWVVMVGLLFRVVLLFSSSSSVWCRSSSQFFGTVPLSRPSVVWQCFHLLDGAAFSSLLSGGAALGGVAVPSFFGVVLVAHLGWCCPPPKLIHQFHFNQSSL